MDHIEMYKISSFTAQHIMSVVNIKSAFPTHTVPLLSWIPINSIYYVLDLSFITKGTMWITHRKYDILCIRKYIKTAFILFLGRSDREKGRKTSDNHF